MATALEGHRTANAAIVQLLRFRELLDFVRVLLDLLLNFVDSLFDSGLGQLLGSFRGRVTSRERKNADKEQEAPAAF